MNDYQKNFILALLAYAAQKDISPEQLCKLSGINPGSLKKKSKAPLTTKQFNDLWQNASRLSNDLLFGLHLGESLQLGALGVVGQIIQSSNTVGDAITQAASLIPLITDLFWMEVIKGKTGFSIRFIPYKDKEKESPFAFSQMMDLSIVFCLHELDGLVLKKIKPKAVKLHFNSMHIKEYERVLRTKPVKKTDEYVLEFDSKYWDEPIITANYEIQNMLLQKVSDMQPTMSDTQTMKGRICGYLLSNAYLGIPTLEEIAANFNTSARSLQRKLQEEGVSYQQLASTIRKSLAMQYLESGNYQVKEISYILGYNELSAFTRAFKKWTGKSPVNYKRII